MLSVLEVMMLRMAPPDEREAVYGSFATPLPGLDSGAAADPDAERVRQRRSAAAERDQNTLLRL